MGYLLQLSALTLSVLMVDAQPSCTDSGGLMECKPGETDCELQKGLVSDNILTTEIKLNACRITEISPGAFEGLPNLKKLDLSDNKIEKLDPSSFVGAEGLTHLIITNNAIKELPIGLFNQTNKLELINLKGNKLTSFQIGVFDKLHRLGFLDFSSNHFKGRDLNEAIFPKSNDITFMDFSGSDMTDSPDNLLSAFRIISFLNLAGCALYEVPKFATQSNLKTINHLMLVNNQISNIDDPKTFENLTNLEILNFAGNSIDSLHEDVFKPLKRLKSIVLSNNKLQTIPDSLFQSLKKITDIDLSQNLIEIVPVNAFRGTALINLNLSKNRFTYLTDNFILELRNSGARLRRFMFENNPWQCACLRDVLREVKSLGVDYTDDYDGKHKQCVTTREFTCKRQPDVNQMFIDLYFKTD